MGQVGVLVLRWNGITEDFQEDCYNVPDVIRDCQGHSTLDTPSELKTRKSS